MKEKVHILAPKFDNNAQRRLVSKKYKERNKVLFFDASNKNKKIHTKFHLYKITRSV